MNAAKTREFFAVWSILFLLTLLSAPAVGQEPSTEDLTKKTQNPVADLISVPFQSNWNFGAGKREKTIYVLNIQRVIPIKLSEEWNLITRVIMPVINRPSLFRGMDSATGLGDTNSTFFCQRQSRVL